VRERGQVVGAQGAGDTIGAGATAGNEEVEEGDGEDEHLTLVPSVTPQRDGHTPLGPPPGYVPLEPAALDLLPLGRKQPQLHGRVDGQADEDEELDREKARRIDVGLLLQPGQQQR
jgi:hypothetical protein